MDEALGAACPEGCRFCPHAGLELSAEVKQDS
jgi:hypothetical protein